jgi:DNA-binding MarR family transcriptional regulator
MDVLLDDRRSAAGGAIESGGDAPALIALVARLHRATRKRVRDSLPGPALPYSQVEVLRLLDQQPGLHVHEVAATLGLAPNTTSTLVQQLVRHGYVERRVDAKDRRAARLEVTGAARQRMERWRDRRAAVLARSISSLADLDRDLIRAALPALERLAAHLEAFDG